MITGVTHLRVLKTAESDDWALQTGSLQHAVQQDIDQGLIPFYLCATVGTTSTATVDDLRGLGTVAKEHNIWCVCCGCCLMCVGLLGVIKVKCAHAFQVYCPVGLCIGRQCLTAEWIRDDIIWRWCSGACQLMSARSVLAYAGEIPSNSQCEELLSGTSPA